MSPARLVTSVAALAVSLSLAAPALAADRFVATDGSDAANTCTSSASPCLTLARAESVAVNDDVIHVAAGTYFQGVVSDKRLTFVGAGAGTVDDPGGSTALIADGSAIELHSGGSVRDMRLSGGLTFNFPTLRLSVDANGESAAYHVSGVVAFGGGANEAMLVDDTSPGHTGTMTLDVSNSSFRATGNASNAVLVDKATGSFVRSDIGQVSGASGALLIEESIISFSDGVLGTPGLTGSGAFVEVGSQGTFVRTRFYGTNGLVVDGAMAPSSATVSDSLAAAQRLALVLEDRASASVRGSTFDAAGPDAQAGLAVAAALGDVSLTATNSVFRATDTSAAATDHDLRVQEGGSSTASLAFDHTSYTDMQLIGSPAVPPPGSGTNIAGDPRFVNEARGDLQLQLSSPLIDRGGPAEAGELDLRRGARALDGNCDGVAVPDIGAWETARFCPPQPGPAGKRPVLSKVRMTNRRFRVGKPSAAARAPRGTRFVYTLSRAADVTIKIERRQPGRKKGRRCVKPRRGLRRHCTRFVRKTTLSANSAAGANSLPFSGIVHGRKLRPGRYRARLRALDAAGALSKERRLSFTIVRG